jgi:hypothetical protein
MNNNKMIFWFVFVSLLFQAVFVSAQNIDSLTGVVLDIRSNQPVKGAKIHLEQRAGFSTLTDELGHFKLKFDPPLRVDESVKIVVEKSGFKTLIQSVQVGEVALTLELTPVEGPNYRKWPITVGMRQRLHELKVNLISLTMIFGVIKPWL